MNERPPLSYLMVVLVFFQFMPGCNESRRASERLAVEVGNSKSAQLSDPKDNELRQFRIFRSIFECEELNGQDGIDEQRMSLEVGPFIFGHLREHGVEFQGEEETMSLEEIDYEMSIESKKYRSIVVDVGKLGGREGEVMKLVAAYAARRGVRMFYVIRLGLGQTQIHRW